MPHNHCNVVLTLQFFETCFGHVAIDITHHIVRKRFVAHLAIKAQNIHFKNSSPNLCLCDCVDALATCRKQNMVSYCFHVVHGVAKYGNVSRSTLGVDDLHDCFIYCRFIL